MDVLFLDAPFSGKVELTEKTLQYMKDKDYVNIGLYGSVQFCNKLNVVKKQLEENGFNMVTSKADRTHVPSQLLGCDSFHNSLNLKQEVDCYLYVGDGKFHPLALVFMQKDNDDIKEIICQDPMQSNFVILGIKDVEKILNMYKSSLIKYLSSTNIGVIVTIKPGQEQLKPAFILEKKYPHKKFYYFIDNIVSFDQLENFNFIDVWVNTACPRIGLDDQEKFKKGVINLNDALAAEEILSR